MAKPKGPDPIERPSGTGAWTHDRAWLERSLARQARAIWGLTLALVAVTAIAVLGWTLRPVPTYFAVTPGFRVRRLVPLDRPVGTTAGLERWAARAVSDTLAIDFVHWRRELARVEGDYTPGAWRALMRRLATSGYLATIRTKSLVASVALGGAPVVVSIGVDPRTHRLTAIVQFPLVITFEGGSGALGTEDLLATVHVVRVPTTVDPSGLAIASLVLGREGV